MRSAAAYSHTLIKTSPGVTRPHITKGAHNASKVRFMRTCELCQHLICCSIITASTPNAQVCQLSQLQQRRQVTCRNTLSYSQHHKVLQRRAAAANHCSIARA